MEGKTTKELEGMFSYFTEQFYGVTTETGTKVDADAEEDGDIEAAIRKEVATMDNKGDGGDKRLVVPVYLDLQCVLFFKTRSPIEPVEFVQRICEDAMQNPKARKTRYANRLTPMTAIGKATENGLEDVGREVLGEYFHLNSSDNVEDTATRTPMPLADGEDCSVRLKITVCGFVMYLLVYLYLS
jgi:tRNA acetyltransferase TAN1